MKKYEGGNLLDLETPKKNECDHFFQTSHLQKQNLNSFRQIFTKCLSAKVDQCVPIFHWYYTNSIMLYYTELIYTIYTGQC